MKKIAILLFALLAAPSFAANVDETRSTGPDPEVSVEAILGSIRVVGWDRNEVQVTGTLGDGIEGLDVSGDEDEVSIEVRYPDRRRGRMDDGEAHLQISVPVGADVEIEAVKCTVEVENVRGELDIEIVHGSIVVDGSASHVEAETVSGDIRISGSGIEVEADSVSGAVIVSGATGSIDVATMSGRIDIDASEAESVSLETMSGAIEFRGSLARDGELSVEAYSSTILLALPSSTSASFAIETQSGDIENEFGHEARRLEGFLPGKVLEFSMGDGSAEVNVESFSGNVQLVRGDG